MDKVQYGILSTAQIARRAHIPAAAKSRNAQAIAIASRSRERAEAYARELDIPRAYGSYEELLADRDVQAVINALPNSMHCEWTVRAAQAGKHVLCEKPLAMTVEDAQRMMDAARANGVRIMEGFTTRFLPQLAFVRDLIASGAIGPVRIVRAELTYTVRDWQNDSRTKAELGGGALFDAGCYCVNTIRAIMGDEPLSVQAFERVKASHGVDTSFLGILRFRDDRLAYLATGMEEPFRACCEVIGAAGRIELPGLFDGRRVRALLPDGELIREFVEYDRFQRQIEHFSDCVLTGQPPMLPLEDARANTAVLVGLKQAAQSGGVVALV